MTHFNYLVAIGLLMTGLYLVLSSPNLVKKVIGLNVFQTAVFILFISLGYVGGGTAPILDAAIEQYSNPLPHVLILTAIVVGVSTTAVALALAMRIHDEFGTIEDDDLVEAEQRDRRDDEGHGLDDAARAHAPRAWS